jgi:cytochrome c5
MNGHGGMPARGGLADLSDSELRSAIIYLFRGPASTQ